MATPSRGITGSQNRPSERTSHQQSQRAQSRRTSILRDAHIDNPEAGRSPPPPYHPTDQFKITPRPSHGRQHETREARNSAFDLSELQARTRELAVQAAPMAENPTICRSERLLGPEQQLGRQGSRHVSRDVRYADIGDAELGPSRVRFEPRYVSVVVGIKTVKTRTGSGVRLKTAYETGILRTREVGADRLAGSVVARQQSVSKHPRSQREYEAEASQRSRRNSVPHQSHHTQRPDGEVSARSRNESFYQPTRFRDHKATAHPSPAHNHEATARQSRAHSHKATSSQSQPPHDGPIPRQSRHESGHGKSRTTQENEVKFYPPAGHTSRHPGSRGFLDLDSVKDFVFEPFRHSQDAELVRSSHSRHESIHGAGPSKHQTQRNQEFQAQRISAIQGLPEGHDVRSHVSQDGFEQGLQGNFLEQAHLHLPPASQSQSQSRHSLRCHSKLKYKDNWVQEFSCHGCYFSQSYKNKTFKVRHPEAGEVMHLSQYKVRAYHVPVSKERYGDERLNCLICKVCYKDSKSLEVFDNDELMMHFKRHDPQDLVDCYY